MAAAGTSTKPALVTGLFRSRADAERAYEALASRGYSRDDVNLMMSDEARRRHFADADSELGDKALQGAGVGSAIGGTVGAVVAAIAAIGTSLVLPGLGLVVAGPLAAALAGAGAGGLTGGLVGALVGAGIPEDRARAYETGIKEGGIVMGVHARSPEDAAYLEQEWKNYRGEQVFR
jgi:hypothetical protein